MSSMVKQGHETLALLFNLLFEDEWRKSGPGPFVDAADQDHDVTLDA
jgi:hypothetical protein